MMVIDKINKINEVIKDIFEFIQSNEMVKNDFSEYLLTIGSSDISLSQMEKIFLPYIFTAAGASPCPTFLMKETRIWYKACLMRFHQYLK